MSEYTAVEQLLIDTAPVQVGQWVACWIIPGVQLLDHEGLALGISPQGFVQGRVLQVRPFSYTLGDDAGAGRPPFDLFDLPRHRVWKVRVIDL